jgi:N-carbamoyl-L-amino-acid hydrolase
MTGSHIDTQPTGGKFDGNYGVLAGLEVVRTLNDHGIETEAPIEVAFWTNEEGSRFVPVMMGSGVFARAFTLEHAYAARDTAGKSVREELERIGYIGTQEPGDHPIGTYFETHIEQGPVLEDHGQDHRRGRRRARHPLVRLHGDRHGGARRPDAHGPAQGCAAGGRHTSCRKWWPAPRHHGPHGRGTVGMVHVHPNSRNVIPGRVKFSIDLRNATDALCDAMDADIRGVASRIAAETGLAIEIELVSQLPGAALPPRLHRRVAGAAKLGYSTCPA